MGGESGVSVRDHSIRESEPSVDMFEVEFGYTFSSNGGRAGNEYCCVGASVVHDCQDSIEAVAFRELGDQVHGDDLKWLCFR